MFLGGRCVFFFGVVVFDEVFMVVPLAALFIQRARCILNATVG